MILVAAALLGGLGGPGKVGGNGSTPPVVDVVWGQTVNLNAVGYEPGLAVDSTGAMYLTAHKNLDDVSTWPYLASWFLMSTDQGASWKSPTDPFPRGAVWETYLGDEGDIAVDSRDYVYFIDTYLIDNHVHVWANQGQWQYSEHVQKTTGQDDRPWLSAQGNGVLHYLGNNGAVVNGGRIWYYRSTDGGRLWTAGDPIPGNGWAQLDAERNGQHAYIINEEVPDADSDIQVFVSDDQGATWDFQNPAVAGHRDGPGREFPWVAAGQDGRVIAMWNDAANGVENGTRVFISVSNDYGRTWNATEVTPFKGFIDYPTIAMGPNNTLAMAFYATKDLPVSDSSEWYLYGAMLPDADVGNLDQLNFSVASTERLYQGSDLHALHDFFEIVVAPDSSINIAFMHYVGPCNGCGALYFVRGELPAALPRT